VFVSEESCPFCAAERWSLAVALSHFGTWSHLGVTKSAATDVFPNTATLSFRGARYQSTRLTLRTTELTDNAGHPLQALSALDRQVIGRYDVPPYVNSADQSGAVPFLDIGNRYVWPARSTTRRCWPGCPRRRSPPSCATRPARWRRPSTARPR
jgi:Domain of unknown function (DUF929).